MVDRLSGAGGGDVRAGLSNKVMLCGRPLLRWAPEIKFKNLFFSINSQRPCLVAKASSLISSSSWLGEEDDWTDTSAFLQLGVSISLYSSFSKRVLEAMEYGMTMLSMSNRGVELATRFFLAECRGVVKLGVEGRDTPGDQGLPPLESTEVWY
jgi:hypothetical protein